MIYLTSILVMCGISTTLGVILVILDRYLTRYGKCKITVNKDINLTVEGGNSLLSYLLDNKIFIPSACGGKGTCGFCKVIVSNGAGPVLPTEAPFLTTKEILSNVRLACQVKVKSDMQLIIPEKYLAVREFKATCIRIRPLTYDTKEITLRLDEPKTISFKPGQYIQLYVPGTSEYRAYSIASLPSQKNVIQLVVRLVPGGFCSTYIHRSLREGDKVSFTGPYGEFVLREDSTKDIICVAGGCGMAPFRSMIPYLLETGSKRNVTYFFGAQTKSDLYYIEEFQRLAEEHGNFRFIVALSDPKKGDRWTGETGPIHQIVDRYLGEGKNIEAYLCGPPEMIEATINVLVSKGMRREDIFFDKF